MSRGACVARLAIGLGGGLACGLAALPAQVTRQERRTVALHAELLHDLWLRARGGEPDVLAKVDAALLTDAKGNPFAPLAHAFAALSGASCDAACVARAGVHVHALPEVVDSQAWEDADRKTPFRLHVTLHTPIRLAETEPLSFDLELHAADGKPVWTGRVGPAASEDLTGFAVTVAVPVESLADGAYSVIARAQIGDAAARAHDLVGRARVFVERGFALRARRLTDQLAGLMARPLAAGDRAAVLGALTCVQRIYTGEASDGAPDLRADLEHVERVLSNVVAERPALHGARGFVPLAVPLSPGPTPHQPGKLLRFRLRAPTSVDTLAAAPLVLFQVGSPTWDGAWWRPTGAGTMPAGFLVRALLASGFDAPGAWACAVLDSDGDLENPTAALGQVIEALSGALAIDLHRTVLIGEREAGMTALSAATQTYLPVPPRGVVCVAGGALSPPQIDLLRATRLLLVPARGHASRENQQRVLKFAVDAGHAERVQMADVARAWPWALPCALSTIEEFCRQCLAR